MKKCPNCGIEYETEVKFCAECGSLLEDVVVAVEEPAVEEPAAEPVVEEPAAEPIIPAVSVGNSQNYGAQNNVQPNPATAPIGQKPKKKNKGLKIALIIGAILAVLSVIGIAIIAAVVILFIVIMNQSTTIDMNDYVVHSFSGYDTAGVDNAYFDGTRFIEDYVEAANVGEDEARVQAWYIYANTSVYVDKTEGLLNGEEISYYVTVNMDLTVEEYLEKSKINLDTDYTEYIEVEGLLPITYVNPFDYITITQDGIDGDITVQVEKDYSQNINNIISFDVSQYYDLHIGDTVTITVGEYYVNLAIANGYGLTKVSMDYVVGDADKYYADVNEMPDEAVEQFKSELSASIDEYLNNYSTYFTGANITYVGTYVLSNTDNFYRNFVVPVYSVDITSVDGDFEPTTVYMSYVYYNAIDSLEGDDSWYDYSWNIEGNSGLYYGWFSQVKGYTSLDLLYEGEILSFVEDDEYVLTATDGLVTELNTEEPTTATGDVAEDGSAEMASEASSAAA